MDVVTGSFGYIGKYITLHLLDLGREVRTITTHPTKPNPFGARVQAFPYSFEDPASLIQTLTGATTLYNTYWIRFAYGGLTYEQALKNTHTLFECARQAGVGKIVHISVTQASINSNLPYYSGKGFQEKMLAETGIPHAIVRPTLVFGKEDILVNNIAWMIRRFPLFPIFGSGDYRVQPIFVEDLAQIAVAQANGTNGSIVDAIGPETFTFKEFLQLITTSLGRTTKLIHMPSPVGIAFGKILGMFLRDVVLTENELRGLMQEMLTSTQMPNGLTRFTDWLEQNKDTVGASYSSEIARHFNWSTS
ncbi:MAG: epimerase [Chloroflexi bacterium GWB2_49_20]|nr:MAG: epimerase [Chloroflexi bacterium GWB2_49_20]OGN79443.1 MAG: epimerase [Chloroflexi bacterium GWC2_49_37]OGN82788.1 MAG: epimerase [Chloroflexi bacterium GWD2_49_16]HCC79688.1 epimerase [Anaerolineae bacterium]HCM97260.1 epimerase [Anaerolineae bacterium]